MVDDNKVLNLDEMFGEDRPVKVKWKTGEYELHRFTALSVTNVLKFQKMRREVMRLQVLDEVTEKDAKTIESLFNAMLQMIGPELPLDEIPYVMKPTILAFYFEQIDEKKRTIPAKKTTGVRSSPK